MMKKLSIYFLIVFFLANYSKFSNCDVRTVPPLQDVMSYLKNDNKSALKDIWKYLKTEKNDPIMFYLLGKFLEKNRNYDGGIWAYEKALGISPKNKALLNSLAECYFEKKDHEKSKNVYLDLLKEDPTNFNTLMLLGKCYFCLEDFEKSNRCFVIANKLYPDSPSVHCGLSATYFRLNNISKAEPIARNLYQSFPDNMLYKNNLAYLLLAKGDLAKGFKLLNGSDNFQNNFNKPNLTEGDDVNGKGVLFFMHEILAGDIFQYIRYAKLVKDAGATVFVLLDKKRNKYLKKFLQLLPYLDGVFIDEEEVPEFDLYCYAMRINVEFVTSIESLPQEIPYLLADEKLVSHWKNELANDKKIKVGVCLHGGGKFSNSELKYGGVNDVSMGMCRRSLPDDMFEYFDSTLINTNMASFYSLEPFYNYEVKLSLHEFEETFDKKNGSFMDTAAVIRNLDLVITVDTSIAHLAGGLGVPVWIMLPGHADWRWFIDREDSPWYPTAKLFRQPKQGDWKSVINNLKGDLDKFIYRKILFQN